MPMTFSTGKTPAGVEYLRVHAAGAITVADAHALNKAISPGAPYEKYQILGLVASGSDFSAEARQALTNGGTGESGMHRTAIVVNSAPLRVMLSFVVRISGGDGNTKFFSAEAPALAWLDERSAS